MAAAEPDDPRDFNLRVYAQGAPYGGDVGTLWCVMGCSGATTSTSIPTYPNDPEDTPQKAEDPGNYCFCCACVTQGLIAGDFVPDLPAIDPEASVPHLAAPQGTAKSMFLQREHHVVRADKEFPRGKLARFYPGPMESWPYEEVIGTLNDRDPDSGATTTGDVTVPTDHPFETGQLVSISWGGVSPGARIGVELTGISGPTDTNIHIAGGEGTSDLPPLGESITIVTEASVALAPYNGSAGKPFFCRRRGRKLWMGTVAGIMQDPRVSQFGINHNRQTCDLTQYWRAYHFAERFMVGDIYETEDADTLSTSSSYHNFGTLTGYTGKVFEASYEDPFVDTLARDFSVIDQAGQTLKDCFPMPIGELYGVGNDAMLFVDPETYSTFMTVSTDQSSHATMGTTWRCLYTDVYEVVPYDSSRSGTPNNGGTDRSEPHSMFGRVHIAEMIYPAEYPSGSPGISGTGASFLPDELTSYYPYRVAMRDAPWCAGRTPDQKSICFGQFVWLEDDVEAADNPGTFTQAFRIDPGPEYGFAKIAEEETAVYWEDETAPMPGSVAYELHLLIQDPPPGSESEHYERAHHTHGTCYTQEVWAVDRLPANEVRGAIDMVLWTEGACVKNDVFHSNNKIIAVDPGDPSTHFRPEWHDYHINIKNPIVDFTTGEGVVTGYEDMLQQPTKAEIWTRRWKLGAEEAGPPWTPFIEPTVSEPNPDNTGASWTIERYNILENGYFPVGACLTPFGDFVYVMLQPWKDAADPFTEDGPRENRYWKVVRPGHWQLKTRLAMPYVDDDDHRIENQTDDASEFTPFLYGDYADNSGQGGVDTSGTYLYKRSKYPVGVKCNEHWLYLTNFPALTWGKFLTDAQLAELGDDPSNEDLEPFEPLAFGTVPLPYTLLVDGALDDDGSLPYQIGNSYATQDNVANEWSIDLATGRKRVNWRTCLASEQLTFHAHVYQPVTITPETISAGDPPSGHGTLAISHSAFSTSQVGRAWFSADVADADLTGGATDNEFLARYPGDWSWAHVVEADLGQVTLDWYETYHLNSASCFDTEPYVDGVTPPPVDH